MDPLTTFILLGEVDAQCKFIDHGWTQLRDRIEEADTIEIWWDVQGILSAAAMLGKLFWGYGGKHATERADLRDMLVVGDDSPLSDPDVRNDFEHYDERVMLLIAKAVQKGQPPKQIAFRNIGDRPDVELVLHHFEPAKRIVSFDEHETSIADIVREARRILPLVYDLRAGLHHEGLW